MENPKTQHEIGSKWSQYTIERWKKNIIKQKIGDTHELSNSFKSFLIGSLNDLERIRFSYLLRGKFVDLGVGRGQKVSAIKGNREQLRAAGIKGRSEGRHAKKWYSKTMYAETITLADLMMQHYGISAQNQVLENIPEKI